MMFSKSRTDRRRLIGDRAAADRLRDHDNAAGIGDNSTEIGNNSAEIGDGAWSNSVPERQFPKGHGNRPNSKIEIRQRNRGRK